MSRKKRLVQRFKVGKYYSGCEMCLTVDHDYLYWIRRDSGPSWQICANCARKLNEAFNEIGLA